MVMDSQYLYTYDIVNCKIYTLDKITGNVTNIFPSDPCDISSLYLEGDLLYAINSNPNMINAYDKNTGTLVYTTKGINLNISGTSGDYEFFGGIVIVDDTIYYTNTYENIISSITKDDMHLNDDADLFDLCTGLTQKFYCIQDTSMPIMIPLNSTIPHNDRYSISFDFMPSTDTFDGVFAYLPISILSGEVTIIDPANRTNILDSFFAPINSTGKLTDYLHFTLEYLLPTNSTHDHTAAMTVPARDGVVLYSIQSLADDDSLSMAFAIAGNYTISALSTVTDPYFEIYSTEHKKCITALDGSQDVTLQTCDGVDGQWWHNNDGTIRSKINDKCLDISENNKNNGAAVIAYSCNGGINQQWYNDPITNHFYSKLNYKCLDISGDTSIVMNRCTNSNSQRWSDDVMISDLMNADDDTISIPFHFGSDPSPVMLKNTFAGFYEDNPNGNSHSDSHRTPRSWSTYSLGCGMHASFYAFNFKHPDPYDMKHMWHTTFKGPYGVGPMDVEKKPIDGGTAIAVGKGTNNVFCCEDKWIQSSNGNYCSAKVPNLFHASKYYSPDTSEIKNGLIVDRHLTQGGIRSMGVAVASADTSSTMPVSTSGKAAIPDEKITVISNNKISATIPQKLTSPDLIKFDTKYPYDITMTCVEATTNGVDTLQCNVTETAKLRKQVCVPSFGLMYFVEQITI